MRKWINLTLFLLVLLTIGIVLLERKAVSSAASTQEIIIEVDNVLNR